MSALYQYLVNRLMAMRREEGQTLTEYALILVLIAIVAIITVTALGGQISAVFNTITDALGV
jgi:pilus assembly protein Flp/PilA